MKKIQLLLLTIFLLSIMNACQPALKEFQPKSDSLFKITFSYPASWKWEEDMPYDELRPGEEPPPSERIVLKDGAISIQVYKPSDPQAQMQEWMDGYLEAVSTMLRANAFTQIDGYTARRLTVLYPPLTTDEANIDESVYLLAKDRFYIIGLYIKESEKDGRFHKQFEELIKTIKILP